MNVLSFDPSSLKIGCALLKECENKIHLEHSYQIKLIGNCVEDRLDYLYRKVDDLMEIHNPDEIALEATFVSRGGINIKSPLTLSMSRGIIFAVAGKYKKKIFELHNKTVKSSFCGNGNASKKMIQDRCELMYGKKFSEDEADSIAIGITHILNKKGT